MYAPPSRTCPLPWPARYSSTRCFIRWACPRSPRTLARRIRPIKSHRSFSSTAATNHLRIATSPIKLGDPIVNVRHTCISQHLAEVVDRPREPLFQRHARLPSEDLARLGDVGATDFGVVLRQWTEFDRRG